MTNPINRRRALAVISTTTLATSTPLHATPPTPQSCTLSYSTYGSPTLTLSESLKLIAQTGYDAVEITIFPDRDAAPQNLSTQQRKTTRKQLNTLNLKLTSLMHNLRPIVKTPKEHQGNLQALGRAAQLAHDLAPNSPPSIQTVLGGKADSGGDSGGWDNNKNQLRDQLGDWLDIMQNAKTVLAIKPHRGHMMSTPTQAAWLINQLGNSPYLRITYDYSHFIFRDMTIQQTVADALPYLGHVAVKDAIEENNKVTFKLPGETGLIDFAQLFKQLYQGGYRKDICVEISSQVWRQPDYNTLGAMRTSYRNMANAFQLAKVPRPKK